MYLFVDVTYLAGVFIATGFQSPGTFAETAHRISGDPLLYLVALTSQLIGRVSTVFLAMGLYVVVRPVNENLAHLALLFRMAEAILGGAIVILEFVLFRLYVDPSSLIAFSPLQQAVIVNLHWLASNGGYNVGGVFYSIGSFLFFYLFFRSNSIPKALSVLGMFASALVPIICIGLLITPHNMMLEICWTPDLVAGISVGLWLLFKGIKLQPRTLEP